MDEITKNLHEDIPCCMLFANDIVLIDDTKEGVNIIKVVETNFGSSGV